MFCGEPFDLEFLAARAHGRRSRMCEGARLAAACQAGCVADLSRAVGWLAGTAARTPEAFECQLESDLIREIHRLSWALGGPQQRLVAWLLASHALTQLKLLLRQQRGGHAPDPQECLLQPLGRMPREPFAPVRTPPEFRLAAEVAGEGAPAGRTDGGEPPEFDARPFGAGIAALRNSLRRAEGFLREHPEAFFREAALDQGYFQELLARVEALKPVDGSWLRPLFAQEVDLFHLGLVVRGRWQLDIEPAWLLRWHVPGTAVPRGLFEVLLREPEPATAVLHLAGRVVDLSPQVAPPSDPGELEAAAWSRYVRLARRAVQGEPMGFPFLVGYLGLRRVESRNLTTICEGLDAGWREDRLRTRLLPRSAGGEGTHA